MRGTNQAIVCLLICFTLIPNIIIAQGEQRCKVKSSKWIHYTIDTCKCLISFEFKFFDSMENLKMLFKGKTVIIAAHRLSTVKDADNIVVLDKGVITEEGTHKDLIAKKGYYYQLIKNQLELGN